MTQKWDILDDDDDDDEGDENDVRFDVSDN
jgi:hypothetical protein